MFKNLLIVYLVILWQNSFNLVYAQQDSQIKEKIIGNWYYFADVNENKKIKDYNEIYFDRIKVQEFLESAGLVIGFKYKIEENKLLINKKDSIFSWKIESINLNQFTLVQKGFKRTFYKVKGRNTLDKVLKNKISEIIYSKAYLKRMSKAKKRFHIIPNAEYYFKKLESKN